MYTLHQVLCIVINEDSESIYYVRICTLKVKTIFQNIIYDRMKITTNNYFY